MNPTILLLDDSQENLDVMQRMLARLPGMKVNAVNFTFGGDALSWCRKYEPDICVVDYHMPGMNGIEFITQARLLPRYMGIPIIMITGSSDSALRQRALVSGANDFMIRPVNPDEFLTRLYNLVTLRMSLVKPIDDIAGSEELCRDMQIAEPRANTEPSQTGPSRARGEGEHRVEKLARDVELLMRQVLEREHEQIIFKLHQLSAVRDGETGNHMHRVAHIARLIAQELGHDNQLCDMIYLAAPMHDIGKVGIPDKILLKPGKLTPEEWEVMKTHTTIGHEVLKDSSSPLLRIGADIAHAHHEKFNGQGYPLGLAGENIPIAGRIVAVADELDALLSVRPYKQAWNFKDALTQMRYEQGKHFDPGCIDIMLRHIDTILDIHKQFADDVPTLVPVAPQSRRGAA